MRAVRILDIVDYMSCPPNSGGLNRILAPLYKMPEGCGLSFDFLFCTHDQAYARKNEEALKEIPVVSGAQGIVPRCYKKNCSGMPDGFSSDVWETMSTELRDAAVALLSDNNYDIVQIEHSQLSWLVPFLRRVCPDAIYVLDSHNVEYRIYESWSHYADGTEKEDVLRRYTLLREWEEKVWHWYDAAFTVSPIERDLLETGGVSRIFCVPTGGGVDIDKYAPKLNVFKDIDLLYIGTMNWYPNYHGLAWFIENVFPIICRERPRIRMCIVGAGRPDDRLCSACKKANIEFLGYQEDDAGYFHRSKVFVVPLWIGAGARVKIITAWASGIPVVSTVFGAEGLDAVDGQNIVLSDEASDFASDVLSLLDNPESRERLVANALDTVRRGYSVKDCAEKLIEDYHILVSER